MLIRKKRTFKKNIESDVFMICGLSVEEKYRKNFSEDLFLITYYQQHFSEKWAGMAVLDRKTKKVISDCQPGLFKVSFETRKHEFRGTEGIGYCGVAQEPFGLDTKIGRIHLCFSGNIKNYLKLKKDLKENGVSFSNRTGDDLEIEVIANLIGRGKNVIDGIKKMTRKIEGTYILLVLTEEEIFAARSPDGHWPLILGRKEGEITIAASSAGFSNLGFKIERTLQPGEIISIKDGQLSRKEIIPTKRIQLCSFLSVYTDYPSGTFQGTPISLIRKRLGASLARRDIKKGFIPDIVIPVPDSGRFHTIGYFNWFCSQINKGIINKIPLYDEILIKWAYAGRSFTPTDGKKRKKEAKIKILPSSENYQGKIVVVIDDSIVRGTQTKANLVPKLRFLGIKEIHFRIAAPKLCSHCSWGKTTKKGECLSTSIPSEEKQAQFLGIEGLEYNSIQDLIEAIGGKKDQLCLDCFSH